MVKSFNSKNGISQQNKQNILYGRHAVLSALKNPKRQINKIIINEGRTTPKVARKEPRIPPWVEPIKVAIFIAKGPGVDSLTAIKKYVFDNKEISFTELKNILDNNFKCIFFVTRWNKCNGH